jgi:hypothetical protein
MKEDFVLSQSKVKKLLEEGSCPRHWFEKYVNESVPRIASEAMLKGLYFEYHCFGENAHDDDPPEAPLSIYKNGKFTAEGKRLDQQIYKFRDWFDQEHPTFQGHTIIATQVKVSGTINNHYIEGIIDFVTEMDGKIYLWDLKYTADVSNTFGDFGWGNYENMDYFQQDLYFYLYNEMFPEQAAESTFVLVMDSSLKFGHKRIPIVHLSDTLEVIKERLDEFDSAVDFYNKEGWSRITCKSECEVCPVEDCPFKWKEHLGFNDVEPIIE